MEGLNTDSLRTLAPSWTLAGDDKLLTLLQNTHQKILSKCEEVNKKLDEMTSSLDDASIDLQNVNNKFMSLSNRQFIESRVYDDDADLTTQAQTNVESPKQPPLDELSMIKNSLAILESTHETAEIIDDSDSDSDVEISVVLKPKDVYSDRPLPYIIGSQQWKSKWHAGLITETSDTDSLPSKEQSEVEYSDSEEDVQMDRHNDNTISESSSVQSLERGDADRERPQPTAAEIAANIATVMARTQPLIERPATPPSPKQHIPVKPPAVYKPTQPPISRVFPDEPPPLEESQQYSSSSSQEDIFAEINKNKPYERGFKVQSGITEDLFGKKEKEDVFGVPYDEGTSYFRDEPPAVKQKPLIKEPIESKTVEQSQNVTKDVIEESTMKKPIGGISVFGSNKQTDTIGAAILKRNIRKLSTSDESESDLPVTNKKQTNMAAESKNIDEIDNRKVEKDIFENLFAKSNSANNNNPNNTKKEQKTIVNKEKKQNIDLFSDNIFDDVDDIFSSDIKIPSKTDKQSLFDDDDDLFTDIAKSEANISKTKEANPQTVKPKLFDSDDELFSDIKTSKIVQEEEKIASKTVHPTMTVNNDSKETVPSNTAQAERTTSKTAQQITTNKVVESIPKPKAISIFDSDSDEDIFNFNKSVPKSSIENSSAKTKLKTEEIKKFHSPSLFDDDEIDELFVDIENSTSKVDSKVDANKVPAKEEFTIDKKENKRNDPISNEIESDIIRSTDPLLSENDKEKSTLNIEKQGSKSFETNIQTKADYTQDISKNEKATFKSEAQSSKSIEASPTSNSETLTADVNKLDKTKTPENKMPFKANIETTPSDKLSFKTTNDQTNTIHSENNNKAKETLLPKPEVPIFNEHLFDDVEPPPFEHIREPIDNMSKETQISENPTQNIVEDIPGTPIFKDQMENFTKEIQERPNFNEQTENITIERTKIPILEHILPVFKNQMENLVKEIPPEVPIFDSIIVTEPPIFENTKEPKKSKNVNALFDDDSEDEDLFFKKNDVISDDKPEVFSNAANFGLFADEPPPDDFENDLFGSKHNPDQTKDQFIESDPISKNKDIQSNKVDQKSDVTYESAEIVNPNNDFSSKTEIPKSKLSSQSLFGNDSDEDIFSFNNASSSKKLQETDQTNKIDKQKSIFDSLDDNLFTTKNIEHTENPSSDNNIIKKDTDTKKVGELATNLNINVQALVPGASPKKTKLEKVDAESNMVKSIDSERKLANSIDIEPKMVKPIDTEPKMIKPNDTEPKMVKSISFEEKPESEVLDNNVSKQRAKIQVKRRPSSRKARHEAVRKSALDLDQNIEQDFEPNDLKSSTDFENTKNIKNDSNINAKVTIDASLCDSSTTASNTNKNINKYQVTQSDQNQNTENHKENRTKVVYVLNDEDIFTNPIKNDTATDTTAQNSKSNEVFANIEDTRTKNDEKATKVEVHPIKIEETVTEFEKIATKIEKIATKTEATATTVEKNATKIEETIKPTKKVSLFDSDDDEADSLFKTKPIIKKTKNTKLFDSDSEDDLFSKKRPNLKEKDKISKKSLFDDDVESDDLFGAKPKTKLENTPKSSTSKEKTEEKTEKSKTIFADPLSLFGDDDDD